MDNSDNNNINDTLNVDNTTPSPQPNISSRKFLPAWDVIKKSFDLFFDNIGLSLFFVLLYIVLNVIGFISESTGGGVGFLISLVILIGSFWFYYSLWNTFLNITKGTKQSIGNAFNIDISRFLKTIIIQMMLAIIYLVPTGIVALGLLVLPDITLVKILYFIALVCVFLGTMIFAIRYIFAPLVALEENCSIFEAFPKSVHITKDSRVGLFMLLMIVAPMVSMVGLIGFFIGIVITSIVSFIMYPVAYRVLRTQALNENDETGIIQKTSYESSKKSTKILYGLCAVGVALIVGVLSLIGSIALSSADQAANDAQKVAEIRTIQSALTIHSINENGFPNVAGTAASCEALNIALQPALAGKITGIEWDNPDYFYCTEKAGVGSTSQWYVIGTKNIEYEEYGFLLSGDQDTDAGGVIKGIGAATQCGETGTNDTVFCLKGSLN